MLIHFEHFMQANLIDWTTIFSAATVIVCLAAWGIGMIVINKHKN